MAKLEEKTQQSRPKTHVFLSCFGVSRKFYDGKSSVTMESGSRRRRSLFSVLRLNQKKSATGKTVPVHFTPAASDKKDDYFLPAREKPTSPENSRLHSGDEIRPAMSEFKPAVSDQTLNEKDKDIKRSEPGLELISDGPKSPRCSKRTKSRTPKSAGRRMEPIEDRATNQRSPPVEIVKSNLTKQSLSLTTQHSKPATNPTAGDPPSKKLSDPIAGILNLTLALLINLLWGKLCAIICTSVWFYMLPLLRSSSESNNNTEDRSRKLKNVETDSDLYRKKKVVFEGFLERNRRTPLITHSQSVPETDNRSVL